MIFARFNEKWNHKMLFNNYQYLSITVNYDALTQQPQNLLAVFGMQFIKMLDTKCIVNCIFLHCNQRILGAKYFWIWYDVKHIFSSNFNSKNPWMRFESVWHIGSWYFIYLPFMPEIHHFNVHSLNMCVSVCVCLHINFNGSAFCHSTEN